MGVWDPSKMDFVIYEQSLNDYRICRFLWAKAPLGLTCVNHKLFEGQNTPGTRVGSGFTPRVRHTTRLDYVLTMVIGQLYTRPWPKVGNVKT